MYIKFSDMGGDLKKLLQDAQVFKDVRIAAITDYEHILKLIPDLAKTPAAIISIGDGGYDKDFVYHENAVGIIIVDKLLGGKATEAAAISIWNILNTVLALFNPVESSEQSDTSESSESSEQSELAESSDPSGLMLQGVWYQAHSWRPLPLGSDNAGYLVQVTARNLPG